LDFYNPSYPYSCTLKQEIFINHHRHSDKSNLKSSNYQIVFVSPLLLTAVLYKLWNKILITRKEKAVRLTNGFEK